MSRRHVRTHHLVRPQIERERGVELQAAGLPTVIALYRYRQVAHDLYTLQVGRLQGPTGIAVGSVRFTAKICLAGARADPVEPLCNSRGAGLKHGSSTGLRTSSSPACPNLTRACTVGRPRPRLSSWTVARIIDQDELAHLTDRLRGKAASRQSGSSA